MENPNAGSDVGSNSEKSAGSCVRGPVTTAGRPRRLAAGFPASVLYHRIWQRYSVSYAFLPRHRLRHQLRARVVVRCADGAELGLRRQLSQRPPRRPARPAATTISRASIRATTSSASRRSVQARARRREEEARFLRRQVVGIGVDTTGSSPIPVDASNRPLALDQKWKKNLNAQCWLWKDHTSVQEAATHHASSPRSIARSSSRSAATPIRPSGSGRSSGTASTSRPTCFDAAYSGSSSPTGFRPCSPASDLPAKVMRGVCWPATRRSTPTTGAACPTRNSSRCSIPKLADLRDRLYEKAHDATDARRQTLPGVGRRNSACPPAFRSPSARWTSTTAPSAAASPKATLVKVIGTSTCDCGVVSAEKTVPDIPGICGIVKGAILPGFYGIEAGQSAVGDIFKWWVEVVCDGDGALHAKLTDESRANRSPASPACSRSIGTTATAPSSSTRCSPACCSARRSTRRRAEIYRALIEATAFGARAILERIREYGVPVDRDRLRRRHRGEKSDAHADLRRRHRLHDAASPARPRPARSARPSPPPCSPGRTRISRPRRKR